MILNKKDQLQVHSLLRDEMQHPITQKMKGFVQHGKISTYDHSLSVAKLSFWIGKYVFFHVDYKSLVRGAFLHDLFLYDWHKKCKETKNHGFMHPLTAARNASIYFDVNDKEFNIIESHMWPLTITKLPKSKEAWIVSIADKLVSTKETLFCRKIFA